MVLKYPYNAGMFVLMSVCHEDLENGFSKLLMNQYHTVGASPISIFYFVFSLGLKDSVLKTSKDFDISIPLGIV